MLERGVQRLKWVALAIINQNVILVLFVNDDKEYPHF